MTIMTVDATRRAQNISACSFDVFDTFLLRACTTPDGVFERVFQLSRIAEKFPSMSVSFVQHRIQAEARARKLALERSATVLLARLEAGGAMSIAELAEAFQRTIRAAGCLFFTTVLGPGANAAHDGTPAHIELWGERIPVTLHDRWPKQ